MTERASVIIVSRNRPDELRRNLPAFRFQTHRNFELILVADPAGIAVAHELGLQDRIKLVTFDEPNISVARNLGLAQAATALVAFIDDDATPEPPWLERLVAPFASPEVINSTGFTRGRNGISYQWKAVATDYTGTDYDIVVSETAPSLHSSQHGRIIKTHGTNCAFRRVALAKIGGFDPGFRFFFDETDVNHRLAPLGGLTAVVPLAQVHHGYAANALRRANRAPTDLTQIGRSAVLFLRRHCPKGKQAAALCALRDEQIERLEHHRKQKRLRLSEIARLMESFDAGVTNGQNAALHIPCPLAEATSPFRLFTKDSAPQHHKIISTTLLGYRRTLAQTQEQAKNSSQIVTLICLSRTARFHRSWFDAAGVWIQRGGLFGRSDRKDPIFRLWRRKYRVAREGERISLFRSPTP